MSPQPGILAIFNDCRPGREAEFEAWFQGEHLIERLAVPSFLFGRRHKAIAGAPGYFNFYMVARGADVKTLSRTARQSDADDARDHVGGFYQHEPHGVPAHGPARQFSRRLRRRCAFQPDTGRDGAIGYVGKTCRRHGGRRW
jgi:hypothetical protein